MHIFYDNFKKGHAFTKIDVRVKIIVTFSILAMVLSSKGIAFPLLIAALCVYLCLKMNVPLSVLFLRFAEPVFIAIVLLLMKLFFSGVHPLFTFTIAGIAVTGFSDGLREGLMLSSRILGAVSLLAAVGFATPFTDFIAGFSWFKMPKLLVELLMLTYRSIFILVEDAVVIYNAQKNRLGYSGIKRGLISFGTLSGELTIRAFDNSQKTAVAMLQRGYTGNIPAAYHDPFKAREVILGAFVIAAVGALWIIQ